jgi:2-polyprenyl-6-methoxyphenol hydroxylase-like FAD-dependent oxidoreductase
MNVRDAMSPGPVAPGRIAVVIGGSIAGLCAARVLSEHVDSVLVLERDPLLHDDQERQPAHIEEAQTEVRTVGALARAGTPQGRHFHVLLARGCQELQGLFPGFEQSMVQRGAHRIDLARDVASLRLEGWLPHDRPSVEILLASRGLTERVVRDHLSRCANVSILPRIRVSGLLFDGTTPRRVRGVRIRSREGEQDIPADLVVDASGRRSRAPRWLEALELPVPAETVVDSHGGYATRWFQAPEPARWPQGWWWKAAWLQQDAHTVALLFPVEQRRWVMTLVGLAGHYPPTEEQAFMETLRRMRSPLIDGMLQLAVPVTGVYGCRELANRFRHYERWDVSLAGFLAVGDAVCALNPVYGQGMTTAALCAGVLTDVLRRHDVHDPRLTRSFFAAQAKMLRVPWMMAVGADFRFPGSHGPRPFGIGLVNRYMDALVRTAMVHHDLRVKVDQVLNMLRPPEAVLSPLVAARVAAHTLRRRFASAPSVSAMPPGAS